MLTGLEPTSTTCSTSSYAKTGPLFLLYGNGDTHFSTSVRQKQLHSSQSWNYDDYTVDSDTRVRRGSTKCSQQQGMMSMPLYLSKSRNSATSANRTSERHNVSSSRSKMTHISTMKSSSTSYELATGTCYMSSTLIPRSKRRYFSNQCPHATLGTPYANAGSIPTRDHQTTSYTTQEPILPQRISGTVRRS